MTARFRIKVPCDRCRRDCLPSQSTPYLQRIRNKNIIQAPAGRIASPSAYPALHPSLGHSRSSSLGPPLGPLRLDALIRLIAQRNAREVESVPAHASYQYPIGSKQPPAASFVASHHS